MSEDYSQYVDTSYASATNISLCSLLLDVLISPTPTSLSPGEAVIIHSIIAFQNTFVLKQHKICLPLHFPDTIYVFNADYVTYPATHEFQLPVTLSRVVTGFVDGDHKGKPSPFILTLSIKENVKLIGFLTMLNSLLEIFWNKPRTSHFQAIASFELPWGITAFLECDFFQCCLYLCLPQTIIRGRARGGKSLGVYKDEWSYLRKECLSLTNMA